MTQTQVYRQGDLAYEVIDKLPDGLIPSKTKVILQNGSGGNPHTFKSGVFYPKVENEYVIGYLKAEKGCKLYHIEHGDKKEDTIRFGSLPVGVYKVRRQNEERIDGLRPVID